MGKVVVDLAHPFSAEIPRWPYFDKPEIVGAHSVCDKSRNILFAKNRFFTSFC